jgi:hypothetical protein
MSGNPAGSNPAVTNAVASIPTATGPTECHKHAPASEFEVGVSGDLIIVREPVTMFYAIFSKSSDQPQLVLKRRRPTRDSALVAAAWKAANTKARELGWIA